MRLALSSTSHDIALISGALTQLEWLVLCAESLHVDGVVISRAHFPRTDTEYLAQVKKLATDIGLTIVGVHDSGDPTDAVAIASSLGAPLAIAEPPLSEHDPTTTYAHLLATFGAATSAAKAVNVTIAVRPLGILASGATDVLQLCKEVDSAWLRVVPTIDDGALDVHPRIRERAPAYWRSAAPIELAASASTALEAIGPRAGFICLEAPHETDAAVALWRTALATYTLDTSHA